MNEPSNVDLLDAVAAALRERVAPAAAHDRWAASELRSIDVVLALVSARLRHGAAVVEADNAALAELLAALTAAGVTVTPPAEDTDGDPELWNRTQRAALESLIPSLHREGRSELVAGVREYLVAAIGREQLLYGALAGRRPF